jgi:hypothetical protein
VKNTGLTVALAVAVALTACNPTYIDHDYDVDADFSQFKTFAWLEQTTMTEGTPQAVQQSGLMEARIKRAVNDGLTGKGLQLVESDADLIVAYHIGVTDYTEIRTTGTGWGWDRNTRVDQFQEGTFILDLIDADADQLVWRGIAEGVLEEFPSPEQMERAANDLVKRLLAEYPPPQK